MSKQIEMWYKWDSTWRLGSQLQMPFLGPFPILLLINLRKHWVLFILYMFCRYQNFVSLIFQSVSPSQVKVYDVTEKMKHEFYSSMHLFGSQCEALCNIYHSPSFSTFSLPFGCYPTKSCRFGITTFPWQKKRNS